MQMPVLSCQEWNVDLSGDFHGSSLPFGIFLPTVWATCPMAPSENPSGLPSS